MAYFAPPIIVVPVDEPVATSWSTCPVEGFCTKGVVVEKAVPVISFLGNTYHIDIEKHGNRTCEWAMNMATGEQVILDFHQFDVPVAVPSSRKESTADWYWSLLMMIAVLFLISYLLLR